MGRFYILLAISMVILKSYGADVFDANKCSNGCKGDTDCPANSHCVAVTQNSDCGLCLCKNKYRAEGKTCVPNDNNEPSHNTETAGDKKSQPGDSEKPKSKEKSKSKEKQTDAQTTSASPDESTDTNSTPSPATTQAETTTTGTTTPAGPTTQGPPPAPTPVNCADYACKPTFSSGNKGGDNDNPFQVRAQLFNESGCKRKLNVPGRPCQMKGGGVCYGVYCLTIESGNDYCICDLYRSDRQCTVDKPGSCETGNGQVPPNAYKAEKKRYRHKTNPDTGSIYGRHFASSFDDCVKLCQWTSGGCRAVNYLKLAGQQVCEMISITITKGSPLEAWLVDDPNSTFQQIIV